MKKMTLCSDCVEVQNILDIDIERLIKELGNQKGKNLTDQEQRYLCLSLLGNEPKDIAKLDYKAESTIRPYLSNTINSYVKNLMGVDDDEDRPSWAKIMCFLKQNGYTMIDLSGESKKTTFKIRLGGQPIDSAIVELFRRVNNPNLSVVFQELKGDEQND
jgi:hypothetical protein